MPLGLIDRDNKGMNEENYIGTRVVLLNGCEILTRMDFEQVEGYLARDKTVKLNESPISQINRLRNPAVSTGLMVIPVCSIAYIERWEKKPKESDTGDEKIICLVGELLERGCNAAPCGIRYEPCEGAIVKQLRKLLVARKELLSLANV